MIEHSFFEVGVAARPVVRGTVATVIADDRYIVRVGDGDDERLLDAELLVTSGTPLYLGGGDRVLCWVDDAGGERGFILGRIGAPVTTAPEVMPVDAPVPAPPDLPDSVVLEAKESLTLRVGDGSITIRADGKILIRGKDLVSHAQRVNRIKGGSVAIN